MEVGGLFHAPPFSPLGKKVSCNHIIGDCVGLESFGEDKDFLSVSEFEYWTVQPAASRYID